MPILKIKDNSSLNKVEFKKIENITEQIANKTLKQLEKEGIFVFPELIKDAEDITNDQMILKSVNESFQTSNAMGFLGCDKNQLIIESRFSNNTEDFFFKYLLEKVLDFPNIVELNTSTNQDNRLFNLFLFIFPYYLKLAMRKGKYKHYTRNAYNDYNVKGTIDIARHIQENIPFAGKIAYNQREFSYDNYLMQLVRHTIEFIKNKSYGINLLEKVKDEVKAIVSTTQSYEYYDRKKVILENKKNPICHAYYHEYRMLQQLCLMILQYDKHQVSSGVQQIHGVLFDGAWLWEEYLNILIGNLFYHPMNKKRKGAQRLFSKIEGGKIGLIYPDFISKNETKRCIADAKYKPINNIGNNDYLQVLAYMFRFDAEQGFYLYPEKTGSRSVTMKLNCGSTYEENVNARDNITVTKLGLQIPPDATSYDNFVELISASEEDFLSALVLKGFVRS